MTIKKSFALKETTSGKKGCISSRYSNLDSIFLVKYSGTIHVGQLYVGRKYEGKRIKLKLVVLK